MLCALKGAEYVIFTLKSSKDCCLASGSHRGKQLPGKKDTCKGPGAGMGLAFRELKGN